MSNCSPDAFALAGRGASPMNVVAVIQHTSGEYLGLMEDHLEGRRIRFQYFRPFAGGGKLPEPDLPADALILLGGGPWGSAGSRDLPTLAEEIELTRMKLAEGIPVIETNVGLNVLFTGMVETLPLQRLLEGSMVEGFRIHNHPVKIENNRRHHEDPLEPRG